MIYFRRLPALLKVAAIIALLAPVLALAILVLQLTGVAADFQALPASLRALELARWTVAAGGLIFLGLGCSLPVSWYASRFRRASPQTRLDTVRSQIGALALLTAIPVAQTVLALAALAPADFPLLTVGLGLDVVELVVIVGAVIFVESRPQRMGVTGEPQGQTGEYKHVLPHQEGGGDKLEPASDGQLPFRRAWWSFDLGKYRPCDGTYCYYPLDSLPPLQLTPGTLDWLGPLDDQTDRQMGIHRNAPGERGALPTIQAEAATLHVTLPEAFVSLMGSPELQDRIPSSTACYFKLSDHIVPCIGTEDSYVVRFLNDQQDVLLWFLYLTPDGNQRVLVSSAPLDELASQYPDGPTDAQEKAIIANTYVCALSFDEFIYRWWLENTIWFKLDASDGGKLTEAEQRYLAHYEQRRDVNPAS